MEKNKQGGKRNGSGRKKLPQGERRKTLRIFPKEKHIEECGGEESAKKIALTAIETYKKT
jgi:hypothetical protein